MKAIYVASAFGEIHFAKAIAHELQEHGYRIRSTWHETAKPGATDPLDGRRADIFKVNRDDLESADVVVAFVARGTPRAAYCEIGFAIAQAKPVIWWVGPEGEGRNTFDAYEKSEIVDSFDELFEALQRAS